MPDQEEFGLDPKSGAATSDVSGYGGWGCRQSRVPQIADFLFQGRGPERTSGSNTYSRGPGSEAASSPLGGSPFSTSGPRTTLSQQPSYPSTHTAFPST